MVQQIQDGAFAVDMRERFERAASADRENRAEALEDLQFVAGEQWPQDVKEEREQDGRPVLTINRMPQFVRQVTNDIRQNAPSIKVRPVDGQGDPDLAETFNGLIRNIENVTDAKTAYVTASESAARCGVGHFRIKTAFVDDSSFDLDILMEPILNPFAVYWDPRSEKPTREDAEFCFVTDRMPISDFKETWPDAMVMDFEGEETDADMKEWGDSETVRIAEYWTKEPVKKELALTQDGQTIDITDIPEAERAFLPIERIRTVDSHKIMHRLVSGVEVLEGPTEWPSKYIPIVPVLGEEVHVGDRVVRTSVIRFAKDAQRLYNYWRSAQAEQIALQPKAPFVIEATQVKNFAKIWLEANKRSLPYLVYDHKDGVPPPQRSQPPVASSGMSQEIANAAEDMKATTGIFDAGLGAKSNETSGVAIQRRQLESDISTLAWGDNLVRAITHAGRILVDLIPKIYDTQRIIRILNEDETEDFVELNAVITTPLGAFIVNDLSAGKYDVVVSTGPSFSTKRIEASESMIEFIRTVPDAAKFVLDLIAKNMDWPGADQFAERFKKALPPGIAEPDDDEEREPSQAEQMAIMQAQLEAAQAEAETAKTQAEATLKAAQAEGEQMDTLAKTVEVSGQLGMMEQVAQITAQRVIEELLQSQPAQQAEPLPVA